MNRSDLQRLADARLREAEVLLGAGEASGAFYLAGYAVECALKACIARETREHDFPSKKAVNEAHTHSLRALLKLALLEPEQRRDFAEDEGLENAWEQALNWSEESRYREYSMDNADVLLTALNDRDHGVMQWIRRYW